MNYLITALICVTLFAACADNNRVTETTIRDLQSLQQQEAMKKQDPPKTPNPDSDWKHLVENSSSIITGKVEEILYVADEREIGENKSAAPNGIVPLPNLKELVKGVFIRLRVEEVIYAAADEEKKIKRSGTVNIYVHNGYFSSDTETPRFVKDKQYLVFLTRLAETDDVKDSVVVQPLNLSKGSFKFDYKSVYKVAEKRFGYVTLTESNQHIIEEVRVVADKLK